MCRHLLLCLLWRSLTSAVIPASPLLVILPHSSKRALNAFIRVVPCCASRSQVLHLSTIVAWMATFRPNGRIDSDYVGVEIMRPKRLLHTDAAERGTERAIAER